MNLIAELQAKLELIPVAKRAFDRVEVYIPQENGIKVLQLIGYDPQEVPIAGIYDGANYCIYRLEWNERFGKWWATKIEV